MEHSGPLKSTQKIVLKKVLENAKTIRSNYYPSTELQKLRTKESMAKYDRNETLFGDKKLKKSKSEELSARDKQQRQTPKKAPVPIIRKGLKTGVLDLLGGNDSFLSTRSHTHSHRYSISKDREDEREEKNNHTDNDNDDGNGENENENENGNENDIAEDKGSVRVREKESDRDRRLLGLYKSNYEGGFRPLNLGPKPVTPASTAAHPDSTYNSDLDDYGAEVWGLRGVVRPNTARALDPDRMYVQSTDGADDPYSASYDIMGRQVAEDEDEEEVEVEGSISSNQGEGIGSRFKSRAEAGTGMRMRYMSSGRWDREEKEGIALEEGSRSREDGYRREGDEREGEREGESAFERSFSEPDRTSGDWKMRRVQEWIHSELPLEGEEAVVRERERELEGRGKGIITSSSERVRQSSLKRSSTSSTYSASPIRLEGVGHTDRRNYNAEEEGEGEGEGEGRLEGGAGQEGFGGSEEKRARVPGHRERENEETCAYDDSVLHFHESKAKSVFTSVTITSEISPRQNEIRRNEYDNVNDKNERQALLSTMERNFWVQDPLLQQQLGLLNDKKNILDRMNISHGNPYKEVEKEGVRRDRDPLLGEKFAHLPLSLPRSFPSTYSSVSPAENIQFSLLSARADIHGIIGNSVNYHSGSLIGE